MRRSCTDGEAIPILLESAASNRGGGFQPRTAGKPPERSASVAASGAAGNSVTVYGNGSYFTLGGNKFEGKRLSMAIISAALARFADRPVVDMTDLKGNYDFTMEFSPEDFRAMMIRAAIAQGTVVPPEALKLVDASSGDTLFNAVEKLGAQVGAPEGTGRDAGDRPGAEDADRKLTTVTV
jgi:uncharacterized protein (TIGR03435 family)